MTETDDQTAREVREPHRPWFLRSRWRLYAALVLLIAVPAGLLTATASIQVRSQLTGELRDQNEMASRLLAVAIDAEIRGLKNHLSSVAARPMLVEAMQRGDGAGVEVHLRTFIEHDPKISRVFVTDAQGIERFDYPHDPRVIGQDFSHRDWYRGVVKADGPYVSEMYRRAAIDQRYVVAVAAPVRDEAGRAIGYLVGQYELRDLRTRMAVLAPTEAVTFAIVDQNGNVATAYRGAEAEDSAEGALPDDVRSAAAGSRVVRLERGGEHLLSVSLIEALGWRAVAYASMKSVTGPIDALLTTIGVLFVLSCTGAALLGGIFTRTLWGYNEALRGADAALRAATVAAEDANRTKSEFLANMSHEIRTPLMAIVGYADLLNDRSRSGADRLEALRVIRRNSDHLLTIINDILDLSKIEAGEMRVECVECSPCRILYDVYSLMRVRAIEKGLEFKTRVDGVIPETICSDPTRLRQILINLVGNAIKFTDRGWVRITTRLVEPEDGGEPVLRFDVADTGIGMSEEQVGRLFRPFSQADSSTTRRFGGTGLGLAICDRLARILGGRIEVQSCSDRGSTFSLFITTGSLEGVRLLRDCREALLEPEAGDRAAPQSVRLKGRILLVEDGKDNRDLLALYLRLGGAEVFEAENGQVACDLIDGLMAKGESVDAVLLDMQMPVLDGYSAAGRMRAAGFAGPILALTAHAMAQDRDRCLRAGCTDYLSKPVTQHNLLRSLARHMPTVPENDATRGEEPKTGDLSGGAGETVAPGSKELLVSGLTDDVVRPYVEAFIAGLPGRALELQDSLAARDLEALADLVHQIKGSGGLFGFMPLTRQAEAAEEVILRGRSIEIIRGEVEALIAMLQRARGPSEADRPEAVPGN
ncbi:MAG: response regulator [Phycisphaerales bacterium]|nr:response regulator [Phycisphaerales bacterium]